MKENEATPGFGELKMDALKRVNSLGELRDIESWKTAFPEIEFADDVDWEGVTVQERLYFVLGALCN